MRSSRLKIPIVDGLTVVELITDSMDGATRVAGLVGLERPRIGRDDTFGLTAVMADYVVYAVGGPGGLFGTASTRPTRSEDWARRWRRGRSP